MSTHEGVHELTMDELNQVSGGKGFGAVTTVINAVSLIQSAYSAASSYANSSSAGSTPTYNAAGDVTGWTQ